MGTLSRTLNRVFKPLGYAVVKQSELLDYDLEPEFLDIYNFCKPYTMTGVQKMYCLWQAVRYVIDNNIPGDFVECGVWRGGSSMLIARTLLSLNITDRVVHLFDTFEGMNAPTAKDIRTRDNADAVQLWNERLKDGREKWIKVDIDHVKANMRLTGYPESMTRFTKGPVEQTLPANAPNQIAILRLDTDWYESTLHEFQHLYPRLSPRGVLIVDDYGHWKGAKDATDEYITEHKLPLLLNRMDNTGRIAVKV